MSNVIIRPLEWELGIRANLRASAFGIRVAYQIDGRPGSWTLMKIGSTGYEYQDGFETQTAAKHAARADFEEKVAAELLPAPTEPRFPIEKTYPTPGAISRNGHWYVLSEKDDAELDAVTS